MCRPWHVHELAVDAAPPSVDDERHRPRAVTDPRRQAAQPGVVPGDGPVRGYEAPCDPIARDAADIGQQTVVGRRWGRRVDGDSTRIDADDGLAEVSEYDDGVSRTHSENDRQVTCVDVQRERSVRRVGGPGHRRPVVDGDGTRSDVRVRARRRREHRHQRNRERAESHARIMRDRARPRSKSVPWGAQPVISVDILVRTVSATPPSLTAPRSPVPLRWLFWSVLLLVGVAAGIGVRIASTSSQARAPAVPLSDIPAGTWAARKLRAPDFSLGDQNGAPVSLAALRGRPVIVTFIDPLCRDYCPLEAQHLNDVVRAFAAGARPAIVAVSVNVYGNARANLLQDERKWRLVPQWRWAIGASGTREPSGSAYHVAVLASTKTVAGVKVHTIGHTEAAYVIDARGFQRALFLWPYSADAVVRTLRALAS